MNLELLQSPLDQRTVNGEAFGIGHQNALDAAVRVSFEGSSGEVRCTGWLIAPRLVVVPAYALNSVSPQEVMVRIALCRPGAKGWEDRAEPTTPAERLQADLGGDEPAMMDLMILRLADAHHAPRLLFRREPPEPGELVLAVHHGVPSTEDSGVHLSFGELDQPHGLWLRYRGSQRPGSGGAVLYDLQWRFLGLHFLHTGGISSGPAQAAVMAMLQRSQWWEEIARHQGLADVVAVRQASEAAAAAPTPAPLPVSALLMRAAMSFSIDPETLGTDARAALAPHVVDASSSRWTLSSAMRRQLLASVPLASLVAQLPQLEPSDRRVIAPILLGTADALEQADEDDLSRWLQAVRWFASLVPGLPSPARVFQLLQSRRIRGRLARISGDFVGRRDELAQMQRWSDQRSGAPLSIWGMGGIGKSALVAYFLSSLPTETILLWLDFDEAALAPDDAAAVIAALHQQAVAQVETAEPAASQQGAKDSDDDGAVEVATTALVQILAAQPKRHIVIVLDSFEAAQYAQRHQELWPVLEALTRDVAGVQVIVSGRAPVPTLRLHGKAAISIALTGLDPESARVWLGRHGIPPGPVQDDVVRMAMGLPLVLKLAERLVTAGGRFDDLPQNLPDQIVAGVLYDRILDRVHNAEFKNVAKGAIVLRCLNAEMVAPVFGDLLPLPAGPAAQWFPEFAREAALVEGTDELRLRPEVRAAALSLLERQEPALVREIDRRALAWYATRDTNAPAVAAERVYHALRLGDEAGAMDAWRDGCAPLLQYADETLHGAAQQWLRRRLGTSSSPAGSGGEVWELEAADRISQSRSAGRSRGASGILHERAERVVGGALAFHEAYEDWTGGRPEAALVNLVAHGIEAPYRRSRERAMLAALIHAERGDKAEALGILDAWSDESHWQDRKDGVAERAAVHAARVCLWAPVGLDEGAGANGMWPAGMLAMDVLVEPGRFQTSSEVGHAAACGVPLPVDASARQSFLISLEQYRQMNISGEPASLRAERDAIWQGEADAERTAPTGDQRMDLLRASWQRWNILADGAMVKVLEEALAFSAINPLDQSVITVLALYAGIPGLELNLGGRSLEVLLSHMHSRLSPARGSRSAPTQYGSSGGSIADDVQQLRRRALEWCGTDLRPLNHLVQRFAGKLEEN